MARAKQISIEEYLQNNLQARLDKWCGARAIANTKIPEYLINALNKDKALRSYQTECFQYFLNYWDSDDLDCRETQPHLLFHMATGSGKTLIMAGLMIFLYEQGYRNFLFFVNSGNVIEKTKDNLLNKQSGKYLFADEININEKRVAVRAVDNFQDSDSDNINLCITTIQGLHTALNAPSENSLTYDDFADKNVVMISDEAHHINAATKKGKKEEQYVPGDEEEWRASDDWESTVMRIFQTGLGHAKPNLLLEFTATEDFCNPAIAEKYSNKVIYDYPLKKFREDKFSKDIDTNLADLEPMGLAMQAVVLSQYKRKLFASIGQSIKPVVMFKSKTIAANKQFFTEFIGKIHNLTEAELREICPDEGAVAQAFAYFKAQGISFDNLILELREDFKEENLLLVDGNNITAEKQKALNSLEAVDNEYRAVFAVDMLNEGWDVLNLFDIVRLYNTRDAKGGAVGRTTNQEAQLIGRGARYMPFEMEDMPGCKYQRKFDSDSGNPLKMLETLHYHSYRNPRYIQELKTALVQSGIIGGQRRMEQETLKESFKLTRLYKEGLLLVNRQERYVLNKDVYGLDEDVRNHEFKVSFSTGATTTSHIFGDISQKSDAPKVRGYRLGDFGNNVIRAALNRFDTYRFEKLHSRLPNLHSIKEFIESSKYLSDLHVSVSASDKTLKNITQRQKLRVVTEVLRQLDPMIAKGGIGYKGSKEFEAVNVKNVFHNHTLTFDDESGSGDKEYGLSMSRTDNNNLRLDLEKVEWYGYNDNFGTSEEKYLIQYIRSIHDKLIETYDEVYLLRNEKDFKLYAFSNGAAYEPDFVLFLRRKGKGGKYDNIQIFIEPKGRHLRKMDAWKEEALKAIHSEGLIMFNTSNSEFEIWGMPFFGEDIKVVFDKAMKESIFL